MTKTAKAALATTALTIVSTGCAINPTAHIAPFQGTRGATNDYGIRVEARIEGADAEGGISGTGCWLARSGMIRGARIDDVAKMGSSGTSITARFGTASFTVESAGGGSGLVLRESRTGEDGKRRTISTTLRGVGDPQCADRFLAEPIDIDPAPANDSIVGQWTGTWDNGNTTELAVDSIDEADQATGRMCVRIHGTPVITIGDFHEGGPLTRDYGPETRLVTIQRQATPTRRHRHRFTLVDDENVLFEATGDIGTDNEKASMLDMRRGTHAEGCLRYITARRGQHPRHAQGDPA